MTDNFFAEHSLKGKIVLVTGATGGIGQSLVRIFAATGACVWGHFHRRREEADRLRKEVIRAGGSLRLVAADLSCWETTAAFISRVNRQAGAVDVLINNAGGVYGPGAPRLIGKAGWEKTMALNAQAPFLLSRAVLPSMMKRRFGVIVNVSSIAVKYGGSTERMAYAAAKGALEVLTRGFARLGARFGVRVNTIRAGFIDTPFHRKLGRTKRQIASRESLVLVGRAGLPWEVAQMALYLASPAGAFITGETLTLAGGD